MQLQNLINSEALDSLDSAGNPAISIVHAHNIADQLNFLNTEITGFGTETLFRNSSTTWLGIFKISWPAIRN
jgi:hypothetical protein